MTSCIRFRDASRVTRKSDCTDSSLVRSSSDKARPLRAVRHSESRLLLARREVELMTQSGSQTGETAFDDELGFELALLELDRMPALASAK
jgi:hypothetical protein